MRRWIPKISIVEDASDGTGSTIEDSGQETAIVEVHTARGRYKKRVDHAKGQTLNPLSQQELEEKYLLHVSTSLPFDVANETLTTLKASLAAPTLRTTMSAGD